MLKNAHHRGQKDGGAKVFAFACAALLLCASVFQGGVLCLCPSVSAGRAETACPCHGGRHEDEKRPAADGQAALMAAGHSCDHLAVDALLPAEESAGEDGALAGLALSGVSGVFSGPSCPVLNLPQWRMGAVARARHRPPVCVLLQRQLC